MSLRRLARTAAWLALLGVVLFPRVGACDSKPGHFGILLPLSGNLKALGAKALDGALMGTGLLSPKGPKGPTFRIIDTEGEPERVAEAIGQLSDEGAVAVVGLLRGEEAREGAKAARMAGLPLVAITPARDVAGGTVYRLYLREEEEMDRLARFSIDVMGMKRFAILAPDSEQGKLYRNLFWDAVVRNGGEIAGSEVFTPGDNPTLKEPLQKLTGVWGLSEREIKELYEKEKLEALERERSMLSSLESAPRGRSQAAVRNRDFSKYKPSPMTDFDALFMPVTSTEAGQLAPQLPYYDITGVTLLGLRSWNYVALVNVGKEYVEGARFPTEWSRATVEGRAFAQEFENQYGRQPGTVEAYGFDGAALLTAAWRDGQASTRRSMETWLAGLSGFNSVTGPLTTQPNGDIAAEPKIMAVIERRIAPAPRETK